MKVSANQVQTGGLSSLKDIQSQLDPIKGSDLEEKFLDLLAQLFQGANLHNPTSTLEQNIPRVKAAEVVARKVEDKQSSKPDSAKPEQKTPAAVAQARQSSADIEKPEPGSVNGKQTKESEAEKASVVVSENDGEPPVKASESTSEPTTKKPEKCGNSLFNRLQNVAAGPDAAFADVVDGPAVRVEQGPLVAESTVPVAEVVAPAAEGLAPVAAAEVAAPEVAPQVASVQYEGLGKEVAELVKKILAEVRRSLLGSGPQNSLSQAVSSSENPIPFELTKRLLGSSNSQLDGNKSLGVDLAALMSKLKQMDPQLLQGNDLLKRLNVLVAKSDIDAPIGSLLGNVERSMPRPIKASPLAELASKKAAEIVERLKETIAQASRSRDGSSLVLNLNPKDLGEVVVKVQQRDDQIFAKISPKAPEVQDVIKAKIDEIVKVLTAAGFKAENVHISVGSGFNLTENGARFAHHYKDGEHSGAPKWSKRAGKEENAPNGATVSYKDGSKSNELAGWVA